MGVFDKLDIKTLAKLVNDSEGQSKDEMAAAANAHPEVVQALFAAQAQVLAKGMAELNAMVLRLDIPESLKMPYLALDEALYAFVRTAYSADPDVVGQLDALRANYDPARAKAMS